MTFAETAIAARDRYERDVRFRNIAQSVVAKVMREHGPVNPAHADREAYDIAEKVAAVLQETFFREDAELFAQRELADRYRKLAEDSLALSPRPPFFLTTPNDASASEPR